MRTPNLLLFLFSATAATACLDAPPEVDDDDEARVSQAEIDVTPVPFCEDKHKNLKYVDDCTLPNGHDGIRNCVDHITWDYAIKLNPFPQGPSCELVGISVNTTCGLCAELDLPGDDGPGGPLDP